MRSFPKFLRALAIGLGLALAPLGATVAEAQPQPNIAVPTPTPGYGYGFEGCYMIGQPLYGNYYLSFCLQSYGNGNYGVTGDASCSGLVSWSQYQAQANIQIQYTTCTNRVSWSPDKMTCYLQPGYQPYYGPGVDPRIAVPIPTPQSPGLQCTYQPSVPGYPAMTVYPQRVYY